MGDTNNSGVEDSALSVGLSRGMEGQRGSGGGVDG